MIVDVFRGKKFRDFLAIQKVIRDETGFISFSIRKSGKKRKKRDIFF